MGERQGGTSADGAFISDGAFASDDTFDSVGPGASGPGVSVSTVDALLVAAVRGRAEADSEGEARAVAAFLAAREQGARTARTRRRDDWRPAARRRTRHTVRTTLAVLLAGLTVGGVAYAAVGTATRDDAGHEGGDGARPRPSNSAQAEPGASNAPAPTASASASAPGRARSAAGDPSPAQDIEAHCRAYEQVEGRGDAMDSTAWKRLADAAGGTDKVAAYCADRLDEAVDGGQGRTEKKPGNGTTDTGTDTGPGTGEGTTGGGAKDGGAKGGSANGSVNGSGGKARRTK